MVMEKHSPSAMLFHDISLSFSILSVFVNLSFLCLFSISVSLEAKGISSEMNTVSMYLCSNTVVRVRMAIWFYSPLELLGLCVVVVVVVVMCITATIGFWL